MSVLAINGLWCLLQVTFLSAIGITISLLVARRYPQLSATSTTAAMATIFIVTLLMPLPIPHWSLPTFGAENPQVETAAASASSSEQAKSSPITQNFSYDLQSLFNQAIRAMKTPQADASLFSPAAGWLQFLIVIGILISCCRFASALWMTYRLCRNSETVHERQACERLRQLSRTLSCPARVELCVSRELDSPVVVGWLRPKIILPPQWHAWETSQLEAVLAHELAHVARRDFFWRMIATSTQTMHFYHPLGHWLWQRLVYSQEVAADQLAAATLGSRQAYSQALSQLAIRQDDSSQFRAEPLLLPTLSSHLIRRIKMLRAKECVEKGRFFRATRVAAIGLIITLGLTTVAMRGLAEPTQVPQEEKTGVSVIHESTLRVKAAVPSEKLFQRKPGLPLIEEENEHGIFLIKVADLLKLESVQPLLPLMNSYFSTGWQKLFPSSEKPEIHLEAIEYISGMAFVTLKRLKKDANAEQKNRLMLGGPYGIVRFKHDISSWKEWVRTYVPDAKESSTEAATYFQIGVIPAIGPEPLYAAAYDNQTLLLATGEELIRDLLQKDFRNESTDWNKAWKSLDTGLISIISSNKDITPSLFESENADVQALDRIFDNIEHVGFGADWDDELQQTGFKVQFYCSNQAAGEAVGKALDRLVADKLKESKSQLAKFDSHSKAAATELESDTSSFQTREDCLQAIRLLENYKAELFVNSDGQTTIEVFTALEYSLAEFVQAVMSPNHEIAEKPHQTTKK